MFVQIFEASGWGIVCFEETLSFRL